MFIVKKAVYDRLRGKLLHVEIEDYVGEVGYAGGGGTTTRVVDTGPYAPQVPYINQLFQNAATLLTNPEASNIAAPTFFPGSTVAAPPPALTQNQEQILNTVTGNQQQLQGAANAAAQNAAASSANPVLNTGTALQPSLQSGLLALISGQNPSLAFGQGAAPAAGSALTGALSASPGGLNTTGAPDAPISGINLSGQLKQSLQGGALNPYLDDVVTAAIRSSNRVFTDDILPQITGAANLAGQRGGSREGIAEGIAASRHDENVSDIVSRLYAGAFDQGAAERGQALGLTSQLLGAQPQYALDAARINESQRQSIANTGINASDLILRQLLGGTEIASGNVQQGTSQAGNLLSTGQSQSQQQLLQSLGLLPSLQASGLAQLGIGNQIGLQQLGQNQALIDDQVQRFFFNQFAPYAALAQFQNFISGAYGSST